MNLLDGLQLKGSPAVIANCSRNDLAQLFFDLGFTTGAEIGVYRGKFTETFAKKGLKIHAIDPWIGYKGSGRSEQKQDMQDYNYECAKKALAPYPNCTIIRKTSMDALADFEDESLDFVYIDGDHRFPFIAQDLFAWSRKVKKGGIVSGHDYFNTRPGASNVMCQVGAIVDAFVKAFGIENFYIFGEVRASPDKYDRIPSWMYIKS